MLWTHRDSWRCTAAWRPRQPSPCRCWAATWSTAWQTSTPSAPTLKRTRRRPSRRQTTIPSRDPGTDLEGIEIVTALAQTIVEVTQCSACSYLTTSLLFLVGQFKSRFILNIICKMLQDLVKCFHCKSICFLCFHRTDAMWQQRGRTSGIAIRQIALPGLHFHSPQLQKNGQRHQGQSVEVGRPIN